MIDEGFAAERTALAWDRAVLALASTGLLLVRLLAADHGWAGAAPGAILVAVAVYAWLATRTGHGGAPRSVLRATGLGTAAAALAAAALALS